MYLLIETLLISAGVEVPLSMQHFGGVDPSGYCYNAWRPNPVTKTSRECGVESKIVREVIAAAKSD